MRKILGISYECLEFARATDQMTIWQDGLYLLCRKLPGHTDPVVTIVKLGLIRRLPGIVSEACRHRAFVGRDYHDDLIAPMLVQSRLEDYLHSLRELATLDSASLGPVVRCQKYLADEIERATGLEARALAARYLHFHLPRLAPAYDRALTKVLGKVCVRRIHRSDIPDGGDAAYSQFCAQILLLQEEIEENFEFRLTLRQIERLLQFLSQRGAVTES